MISREDIEHTASLARIKLTEDEIEKLSADLGKILDYVGELQQVDTTGVDFAPKAHPPLAEDFSFGGMLVNNTREDESRDSGIQDAIVKAAPKQRDGYFEVKGVFE